MTAPIDTGWEAARAEGIRLLEERNFAGAAKRLEDAAAGDPGGESEALLGLAHFHSERYSEAARHYARALQSNGGRAEWQHMLEVSEANASAEIEVPVPPVHYFERDALLGPPPTPSLPEPPAGRLRLNIWRRVRYLVGHGVGTIGGATFGALTSLVGKRYLGDVWTNWYRKRLYTGILTLAYMREKLNRDNLKSTYPTGAKIGFQPDGLVPPAGVTHFRTADGSWNNLDDPKEIGRAHV